MSSIKKSKVADGLKGKKMDLKLNVRSVRSVSSDENNDVMPSHNTAGAGNLAVIDPKRNLISSAKQT